MTRRQYVSEIVEIVWPDGRQIGFMIRAGYRWFGPYMTFHGESLARLT
jgi:hypothetical protein